MVHLRNLNHTRRILVRTQGAPAGRLIPPGATTAIAVDLAVLADPQIQQRLAQARVAVLDQGGWSPDLRQRRAGQLSWRELVAQAERAEMDRLRQHQVPTAPTASSVRRRHGPWAFAPRPSLHGETVHHRDGSTRTRRAPFTLREIYTHAEALSTRTS
jgi:hypothetical protein